MFKVRPLHPEDMEEWLRMRRALWTNGTEAEMRADRALWLSEPTNATLVLVGEKGHLCGFIEVGQRKYAEGCESSSVGYIEGWYVDEALQREGGGKMLVIAAEDWVREQAWAESASGTWLDNETGIKAQTRAGVRRKRTSFFQKNRLNHTIIRAYLGE